MRRRGWRVALMGVSVAAAALAAACGGGAASPDGSNGTQQPEQQPAPVREVRVTSSDVGAHLESTTIETGLPSWLLASVDPVLSALPGRALSSSGILFAPSASSTTDEVLWLHVFTDESSEQAVGWARYLASRPPELAAVVLPAEHELFRARFLPQPLVGDASVSVELVHGHSGGCWRSVLLVFAQEQVLVFMFNPVQITNREGAASVSRVDGLPQHCDVEGAPSALTDIGGVARVLSERLASGE